VIARWVCAGLGLCYLTATGVLSPINESRDRSQCAARVDLLLVFAVVFAAGFGVIGLALYAADLAVKQARSGPTRSWDVVFYSSLSCLPCLRASGTGGKAECSRFSIIYDDSDGCL
jgi:hypothetical protein